MEFKRVTNPAKHRCGACQEWTDGRVCDSGVDSRIMKLNFD